MKTIFESRYAIGPQESKTLDTAGLRKNFLIEKLFDADQIHFVYTHYDRYMAGGAMPVSGKIKLDTIPELLKEEYFLSRRELGIINVGGKGSVEVDGTVYELDYKEALYIGKGNKEIFFSSEDTQKPAKFYMNSTPAHRSFPTKKVTKETAIKKELGTLETANHRTIKQMLPEYAAFVALALAHSLSAQQKIVVKNPGNHSRHELISIPYSSFTKHFKVDSVFTIVNAADGSEVAHQLEKLGQFFSAGMFWWKSM
ncbi:hypothetical protein FQR65_LT16438 [Abscondita terminalis]|nr:hypothetical protein FQR65_LT16438 [Abscondita terminalis]